MHIIGERSERDTIRGVQIRAGAVYVYIYIYIYMEVCVTNSSACYACVMWAELGHCHFLYVPAVSNSGNGTGTKNVLKWNRALGFEFGIQSSVFVAESMPILYLDTVYCKFLLYVSIEIDPFKHR